MTPEKAAETMENILARIMRESAEKDAKWIRRGIVGLSVFCICLGILGAVAVVKSIFL